MLRYKGENDFERWLSACPLDERAMNYSVTRAGDGLLTVQVSWRVPPATALPASLSSEAQEHKAAGVAPASEAEALGGDKLQLMEQLIRQAAVGHHSQASSAGGSGSGGGAALAMAMAMSRSAEDAGTDGERKKPSAEEIRAMMAMTSGVRFPKPPGTSFS